ncbi:MAG: GerMN domain-containing protein [Treponema sp.]|nr:GerMN domain-containing protein [Treponema sp.]
MSAAVRKKAGGAWLLFWLVFLIGVTVLFMANMERIKGTLIETRVLDKLFKNRETSSEEDTGDELERQIHNLANGVADGSSAVEGGSPADQIVSFGDTVQPDSLTQQGSSAEQGTQLQQGNTAQQAETSIEAGLPGKTVTRSVYLMRVDGTGAILWTNVKRDLPASDSPLSDTLEALIKGPSAAEEKQGLISLIPKNVKIQNAVVRGSTAYISFSEDFLFNTYGTEGYAGQRRQIVLTATEFSNVKDVQILIDGKRVDYLGEGIWIGSPVSRSML